MAKKKTTTTEGFAVVKYTDGATGVCPLCEVNTQDERIAIVSEHPSAEEAQKAHNLKFKKQQ